MKRHTIDNNKRRRWARRATKRRLPRPFDFEASGGPIAVPDRWLETVIPAPGSSANDFEEVDAPTGPTLRDSDYAYLAAGDFTKECVARKRLRDAGLIVYNPKSRAWSRT